MAAPLHFRKAVINGTPCLVPIEDTAEAWLGKRKPGDAVAMDPNHVRNAERSALYWVCCSLVANNHAELKTQDEVSDALQILAGSCRVTAFDTSGGRIWMRKPKSLAFASMGEDEFVVHLERSLELIETELLPGVDIELLRRQAYLRSGGKNDYRASGAKSGEKVRVRG